MLNKLLKMEYEELELGEAFSKLMAAMIAKDNLTLRVMVEIAKKDQLIHEQLGIPKDNRGYVYGITKKEIRKNITLGERVVPSGKNKGQVLVGHPADKKIDTTISFLTGATLVYCDEPGDKTKRYLFTRRALEVISLLCKKGYLDSKELRPSATDK